ncbi:EF hand [Bremerella volcania]|uniref:EF hand n=1 Tax=Bremerella volcania TaxID=2527984 RepID=A0A518CB62_9BACT|nr:hypothetical protein [Bremerella volcania]QDU76468.1 EF hand [Bremerella volcania]
MSLRSLFVFVALSFIAVPSHLFSQDEAEQAASQESAEVAANQSTKLTGPHADYFQTLDTNGDGKVAGEEVFRLPMTLKSLLLRGQEPQDVVIEFDEFHTSMEEYRKRLLERYEKQRMEREAVQGQRDRELAFMRYHQSLMGQQASSEKPEPEVNKVTLESSPHAEYFRHFDKDGNGVLDASEQRSLPDSIVRYLDHTFADAWRTHQITIHEFHNYWEAEKQALERRQETTAENLRFQNYRTKFLVGDRPESADAVKPAPARGAPVRRRQEAEAKPEKDAAKSFTVEIMMLRRTSNGLPDRTLASEVASVLEGAGPSLSARLLPWLNDPDSPGASLVDYIQAQSIDGQSIAVQRGGSEPYVSGTTSMGSRGRAVSYNMQNVGTLVRVESIAIQDSDKLGLSVQFEKSYLEHANDDDEESDDEPEPSSEERAEASDASDSQPAGSSRSSRSVMQGFGPPTSEPAPPPTIATITAEGKLVLPAKVAGVLTEMAKQSGDTFEEVVILVQWN